MKQDFKNLRNTFWDHTNRITMLQDYFKMFLSQEAGAFGKYIEKEPEKPHKKLKKYVYYIFKESICSACNPMQVIVFCKNVLTL